MPIPWNPRWRPCQYVTKLSGIMFIVLTLTASLRAQVAAGPTPSETTAASPSPQKPYPDKPYHLPPDKLAKAKALGSIRTAIHFGSELWQLAVLLLVLATGTAARLSNWASARTTRGWLRAALFSAALIVLIFLAAELPVASLGHYFSLHYGISIEGWSAWLLDQAKVLGLEVALDVPGLMLVYGLMHWSWSRRRYWVWVWAMTVPAMILGVFLLPQLVDPLFNTFEPLAQSHPELVRELQRVVARTGTDIPPKRMFLMKASEKSNGLNAYVTGLGSSKRIVVWDTTADRMPTDEILFTFGHESGHYVLNHIPKGLALGAVGTFALCGLTVRLGEFLVCRWGARWGVTSLSSLPGLAVLMLALAVWQTVTEPAGNFASRYAEHQADVYGQEAMHGIVADPRKTAVAAFNDLGAASLDNPDPNPIVEFWTYDHPSTQNRARFAAQYDPWANGQTPEFFSK